MNYDYVGDEKTSVYNVLGLVEGALISNQCVNARLKASELQ